MSVARHHRPLVVAHRGVHGDALPENSLAAFERAVAVGADMIELDVRRCAAGELIAVHDHEVDGTPVAQLTRAQLSARIGHQPPLLSEVLSLAAGRIALDVELKEDGYVEQVVELLPARHEELIVTSFIDPVLHQLRQLAPGLSTGLLIEHDARDAGNAVRRALRCGAGALAPAVELVSETLLDALAGAALRCYVWNVHPGEHGALLRDERVAAVITDDVPGALDALARR